MKRTPEIAARLSTLRGLFDPWKRPDLDDALHELESALEREFERLELAVSSAADANVRGVELLTRYEDRQLELQREAEAIAVRARDLEARRASLEEHCDAVAAGNVEAVLMMAELETRAAELDTLRRSLEGDNADLRTRSARLDAESESLAASNAAAVEMLDGQERKIEELAARAALMDAKARDLEVVANRDDLTGLANNRLFRRRIDADIERAHAEGSPLAVVLLDVDHFKRVNDTHGHLCGDDVLRGLGRVLAGCVRGSDLACPARDEVLPARYGGEEFVVLLPGADSSAARLVAERIRQRVADAPFVTPDGTPLPITISAGFACLEVGEDALSLLSRADTALYAAKRGGRNQVRGDEPSPPLAAVV